MPKTPQPLRHNVTLDTVRSALACIPPDVDRDTWVRIGMAIKSHLGDEGHAAWDAWSQGSEAYRPADARDTWRSFKAGGRITIGTLFGIAKDHGFRFPEEGGVSAVDEERARRAAADAAETRRRLRAAEEAEYRERADRAAREARALWGSASAEGASPYLTHKGVRGHGVRYLADGTLLVPMVDAEGQLQSLQRIAPGPSGGGAGAEKRYMAGARKTGLFHVLGEPDGASLLLLAEGYATAATLHEATGRPVVVCFDAGNLVHVAKALRERWPDMPMLVCADDDQATERRTGKNPGREKAMTAVRAAATDAAASHLALPKGLPEGGTDFNDLAAHSGLSAVASVIEDAARELLAQHGKPLAERRARRRPRSGPGASNVVPIHARQSHDSSDAGERSSTSSSGGGGDGTDETAAEWDPFFVSESGVYFVARDANGEAKRPAWVCAPLHVTARTRADDLNGWGYLLEFRDPDGHPKTWAMPSSMLSGEGAEWAARLRDMGLQIAPGTAARNRVAQYIDTRKPADRVTCTDRVGWHGPVYVLPSSSISPTGADASTDAEAARRHVFQSDSGMEDTFKAQGTLAGWQHDVATLAQGNTRLVFALSCAFAGPLVRPAGVESGGFHFRGDSSVGKTTALKVAASVWGRPTFMQRWRTTDNALEAIAAQHCDCTLILDEFGQLDPKVAGECAYMLANESEKGRATRGAMLRKRRTWRLLFLSSGEISLADHMAEAGKRTRAGMEVRMLDIPLDAGRGMGGIEALHHFDQPGTLADTIVAGAARHYGEAGRTWIQWCSDHFGELPARLAELIERYREALLPGEAAEQVRRAAARFALVAAAGELATEAGITGWEPGEAEYAARGCFASWMTARGHADNSETVSMLHQVRHFLQTNAEGRFTWAHRALDDHAPKTLNRAGFRRLLGPDGHPIKTDAEHLREYGERISAADQLTAEVEYIVLREVFEREVCRGFAPRSVATLLKSRGHLATEEDRLTDRQRLPGHGGSKVVCYRIRPSLFCDEL